MSKTTTPAENFAESSAERPATLEDLGRILGLSKRAVSQALNDRPGTVKVSVATKERVLALAKSVGYRPNTAAKSLTTGRTGMYGIFASTGKMHIRAVHLSMAVETFRQYEITPIVISSPTASAEDMEFGLSALINARVDGVLLLQRPSCFLDRHLAELRRYGMSVVQVGSSEPVGDISHYAIDWSQAYAPALDHLLKQGYRRIGGLITNDDALRIRDGSASNTGQRTRTAMLEAVNAARNRGQSFDFRLFDYATREPFPEDIHSLYQGGYGAMKEVIRRREIPEAMMCQVDGYAFGAMRACHEEGVRIPDDMAITGFSNEPACSGTYLPMTSIEEPFEEMCAGAVKELVTATRSGTPASYKKIVFPCRLVERMSSLRKK